MIAEKIAELKEELGNVKLVAVTKNRTVPEIKEVILAGAKYLGENRVQEAHEKYPLIKDLLQEHGVDLHMIGHLQTNKAKAAVMLFDVIQSIDSLKVAEEIETRAKEINKVQDVMVQVNIGREPQKHGIQPEQTEEFVKQVSLLKNIKLIGLMCIAPYSEDPQDARPYFREMKSLFDKVKNKDIRFLSMGMTNDYRVAVEEGSNMVRIGTRIFGERNG